MRRVIVRGGVAHQVRPDAMGWPECDFVEVDDANPVQPGWIYSSGTFVDPASTDGQRIAANAALVDARIASVIASLTGLSVTSMTAQQRVDLIVVMARKLGIEVKP